MPQAAAGGSRQAALSGREWQGETSRYWRPIRYSVNNPKPPPRGWCSEKGLPEGKPTKTTNQHPPRPCICFPCIRHKSQLEGPGRGPSPHRGGVAGVMGNACLRCAVACRDTGVGTVVPPPTVGERGQAPECSHPGFRGKKHGLCPRGL